MAEIRGLDPLVVVVVGLSATLNAASSLWAPLASIEETSLTVERCEQYARQKEVLSKGSMTGAIDRGGESSWSWIRPAAQYLTSSRSTKLDFLFISSLCESESWSGCSKQVPLFPLLLWLGCENWHFLWVWRHLASFVEDDEEDEDEDAHRRVTCDGRYGPHRQSHSKFMLHSRPDSCLHAHIGLQRAVCRWCQPGHLPIPERKRKCLIERRRSRLVLTCPVHTHTLAYLATVNLPVTWACWVLWWGQLSKDYFPSDRV